MENPFTARRPWAAAIISLVFGPFIGMLYLNRGRAALCYLAVMIAAVVTAFFAIRYASIGLAPKDAISISQWPVILIGVVHSWLVARRWNSADTLRWYAHWYWILTFIVVPIGLALLIRTFLYQPFDIPSTAMSPSLNKGDYFFVSKFAYNSTSPRRGDIIVFHAPQLGNVDYVKRVVGLPGDRIRMRRGVPSINDAPVKQRRIADFVEDCGGRALCHVPQYMETLPGGRSYTVLDRVPNGPLDNTDEFLDPANCYFVLGDNRDNSNDSRADVGYVCKKLIVGPVVRKFVANSKLVWQPVR